MAPAEDALAELRRLGAATVHEVAGDATACGSELRTMWRGGAVAGPAFTVRGHAGDNLVIHHSLEQVSPGEVLVMQFDGSMSGHWGEVLTVAATAAGVAGLVLDGGVRDVASFEAHRFPVFARGTSLRGTGKHHLGALQVPVVVAGVAVAPGDIVVADDDGVSVFPRADLNRVIEGARGRETRERAMMDELRGGKTTVELLGLQSRAAHPD